ncbi:MAG: Fe-S cluster assembly ATPase SufC [Alphaproteobacteria bacterium]|nr:Fe-S cluster assembly ATPase SufC [Alphaproteobacteria bacterium]
MLTISDLHVSAAGEPILKGVTLTLDRGETHLLMGHNGAGKSTLGWVLAGHEGYTVTSGTISFDGQDLLAMLPEERALAGFFLGYQHPVPFPGLTVAQFLREVIDIRTGHREAKAQGEPALDSAPVRHDAIKTLKQIRAACATVGVPDAWLKRHLNEEFSGGEKKRLEMLQMQLLQPKLAVLDEYDSGLDIDSTHELTALIESNRAAERSMLLITHYTKVIKQVQVDKVHVLVDGKIVFSGPAETVERLEADGYAAFAPKP